MMFQRKCKVKNSPFNTKFSLVMFTYAVSIEWQTLHQSMTTLEKSPGMCLARDMVRKCHKRKCQKIETYVS